MSTPFLSSSMHYNFFETNNIKRCVDYCRNDVKIVYIAVVISNTKLLKLTACGFIYKSTTKCQQSLVFHRTRCLFNFTITNLNDIPKKQLKHHITQFQVSTGK